MRFFSHNPSIIISLLRAVFYPRASLKPNESLPRLSATRTPFRIDRQHLQRYCHICDLPLTQHLPLLYPHVIAAPLHMWLITHPRFPLRLLGAVHLRNQVIQQRAIHQSETLTLTCAITTERRTDKGLEFDFTTVMYSDREIVWEGITTYFVRGRFGSPDEPSNLTPLQKIPNSQTLSQWQIPSTLAKRYAAITQDYNPIHLSTVMAKWFGFKRDLVHGFCVLAQSLEKGKIFPPINPQTAQRLDVIFKGPVYVNNTVILKQAHERFDVYSHDDDRPCIEFLVEDMPTNIFLTVETKKLQQG